MNKITRTQDEDSGATKTVKNEVDQRMDGTTYVLLALVALVLLGFAIFSDNNPYKQMANTPVHEAKSALRPVYDTISPNGDILYVDDDTGVLYVYVMQGQNEEKTGSLSVLVNADGTPKLYDDYRLKNEIDTDD